MLKVCVNGARRPDEHAQLSADPERVAEQAAAAVAAGAVAVHVHPKSAQGADSVRPDDVGRWVEAMRQACPGAPIGVTTGAWAERDVGRRLAAIRAWTVLPDFASVNWHEEGADEVAATLRAKGVGIEAGIWHHTGLAAWLRSHLRDRCLRVLVELPDAVGAETVRAQADSLVAAVQDATPELPVLLHGEERSTWPAIDIALARGLATRVGLEDTLVLPDGQVAEGNAQLVTAVLGRMPG